MNKSKLLLSLVILLTAVNYLAAQKQKKVALYLKTGSIIYGKITENIPDSIVKIKDRCDNIWAFKNDDIRYLKDFNKEKQDKNRLPYYLIFDTGIAGFGSFGNVGLSLLVSGVYSFNNRYYFGLMSGVESFGFPLLPVAGDLRINIFDRNVTPYVYIRSGYAFKMIKNTETGYYDYYSEEYKGGIMFGAGIGIERRFTPDFALTFSIGYRHQETYDKRVYISETRWNRDYVQHYFYNRTAIRVGLVF